MDDRRKLIAEAMKAVDVVKHEGAFSPITEAEALDLYERALPAAVELIEELTAEVEAWLDPAFREERKRSAEMWKRISDIAEKIDPGPDYEIESYAEVKARAEVADLGWAKAEATIAELKASVGKFRDGMDQNARVVIKERATVAEQVKVIELQRATLTEMRQYIKANAPSTPEAKRILAQLEETYG